MNREKFILSVISELKNKENMNEVELISVASVLLDRLYDKKQPNRWEAASAVRRIIYRDWET